MALKVSNKNRKKEAIVQETVVQDVHQEWVQKQPFPVIPVALFLFFMVAVFLS